jgi:hypothetical protein
MITWKLDEKNFKLSGNLNALYNRDNINIIHISEGNFENTYEEVYYEGVKIFTVPTRHLDIITKQLNTESTDLDIILPSGTILGNYCQQTSASYKTPGSLLSSF